MERMETMAIIAALMAFQKTMELMETMGITSSRGTDSNILIRVVDRFDRKELEMASAREEDNDVGNCVNSEGKWVNMCLVLR